MTRAHYADKEALAKDVVPLLRAGLAELRSAGAEFVQFDEPVLTEVGSRQAGRGRSCARRPMNTCEIAAAKVAAMAAAARDLRGGS